jgi:hypothetical protein
LQQRPFRSHQSFDQTILFHLPIQQFSFVAKFSNLHTEIMSSPTGAPLAVIGGSGSGAVPSVRETFRGKHVLITGSSGFLGKCLVEKILREIPDIGGLHLLVRPRKGFSTYERMQQEIVQSEIFTNLRAQRPDFDAFVKAKLHAVPGELTQENCGMSKVWIHLNFRARLDQFFSVCFVSCIDDFSVNPTSALLVLVVICFASSFLRPGLRFSAWRPPPPPRRHWITCMARWTSSCTAPPWSTSTSASIALSSSTSWAPCA